MISKNVLFLFLILLFSMQSVFSKPIILVRGDDNYPPFEMKENGKLVGIHIELIQEISKLLSVEIKILEVPWKRALVMVKKDLADGILYVTTSNERRKYIDFLDGNIMFDTNISLFSLKKKINDSSKKKYENSTVGAIRGFYYGGKFEKMRFNKIIKVTRLDQLIDLLKCKRIDYFVASETEMNYKYFNNRERIKDIDIDKHYISVTKNYLGFSKNRKIISKKFSIVMRSFRQTKKFKEILKKYKFQQN